MTLIWQYAMHTSAACICSCCRLIGGCLWGSPVDLVEKFSYVGILLQAGAFEASKTREISWRTHPGCSRRVWIVEQSPDLWLPNFTTTPRSVWTVFDAEPSGYLSVVVGVVWFWRFKYIQGLLCVPMLPVCHPAAWLHVCLVNPPKRQLLLEERPADIGRAVQLAGSVVVQHVGEDARVSVEEEFSGARRRCVRVRAVLGARLCQPCQAGPRQGPESAFVGFVSSAAHVDDNFVRIFSSGHLLLQTWFRRRFVARLAPSVRRNAHGAYHWKAGTFWLLAQTRRLAGNQRIKIKCALISNLKSR